MHWHTFHEKQNTETKEIVENKETLVALGHNTIMTPAKAVLMSETPDEAPGCARENYRATLEK